MPAETATLMRMQAARRIARPTAWKLALLAGFVTQLLLIVFVTAIGLQQLGVTTRNLHQVVDVHMRKQNYTKRMVVAARERTVILLILPQKIIYPLSQGDYAARVLAMREQRAWPELRPSSTVDHGYLLRAKGFPFSRVYTSREWWRMSYQSLYGYFGYLELQAPLWAYWGAPLLMLVGIICTYVDFIRRRAAYPTLTRLLLVAAPALSLAILFASLYYSWIFDFQPQGRYLQPAMLPLALLIGGAVDDEPRWLRLLRLAMWVLLLGLSFYTLWELIMAAPMMRH